MVDTHFFTRKLSVSLALYRDGADDTSEFAYSKIEVNA